MTSTEMSESKQALCALDSPTLKLSPEELLPLVRRALARGSMIVTTPHLLLLLSLDSDSNALRMAT
jgi:hypothetical protein